MRTPLIIELHSSAFRRGCYFVTVRAEMRFNNTIHIISDCRFLARRRWPGTYDFLGYLIDVFSFSFRLCY